MKCKSMFVKTLILAAIAGTALTSTAFMQVFAKNGGSIQEDIIKPLSHIRGEEVNTLSYSIQDLYQTNLYDKDAVFSLYDAAPEMHSRNWTLLSSKDYAKKYFRSGTKSINASHNSSSISIPVLFTDSGKFDEEHNIALTVEGNYKTIYIQGESFDSSNAKFYLHYYDNKLQNPFAIKQITSGISYSKDVLVDGQTSIKASYQDLSVNIPIFVGTGKSSTDIIGYTISGNYKTLYKDWDAFDRTNLSVIAHLGDASTKDVTSQLTWPSDEFEKTKQQYSANQTALYEKWDDFHQINNVLKWEAKNGIDVENYDVIVSMNPELTQTVYKAKVTQPMYEMKDIYTGCNYYWQVKVNLVGGTSIKSPIYSFKTASTPRTVHIEGISNSRDIGGYMTQFGYFKQGYVYRGSKVDEISDVGLDTFKNKLGIQTDVDLRTPNTEVGKNNPLMVPYYVGPVDMGSYSVFDPLVNVDAANRAAHLAKLKTALEPFTKEESYPIYFHCAVGRDRTGTLGAIIDALMGLDEYEILRKYFISVFSVTGHYQLSDWGGGYANGLSLITMLNNHQGTTLCQKAEALVKEAGLTDSQIQKMRDILTGKTEAKNSLKFLENDDNYEGQIIVNFKQVGSDEKTVFTAPGSVVVAPVELKEGYAWFNGDEIVDLSKPLNESVYLVAKRLQKYQVTIHYMKGEKNDIILDAREGDIIKIADYAIDGKVPTAFLDTGKEISSYKVIRNAVINLLFN